MLHAHQLGFEHLATGERVTFEASVPRGFDVLISSVSTGGSGGEDRLTEHVSLNFAKVKVDYTEQTATGSAGAKPKMGWDIEANKKL